MEEIEASVDNIIFQSGDGQFAVFRALSKQYGKITAVYRGIPPFPGEQVKLKGEWIEHPRFGKQFKISVCQATQISSADGIERFLASGAVSGIGKATAARIVAQFGDETLRIMAEDPDRLKEVEGIGEKKALVIAESYAELADLKELMLFLESNGIGASYAHRIYAQYGNAAIARIRDNPYCLAAEVAGIGFRTADRLAVGLGIRPEDGERIKAGIEFALVQAANNGNICLPEEKLLTATARLLQIDTAEIYAMYNKLVTEDLLRTEEFGGSRLVYPEYLYRAEINVASRLLYLRDRVNRLWQVDYLSVVQAWEAETGFSLAEAQIDAVKSSLEHGIFILTGGPGTGKTTVVKCILQVLAAAGCKILLAAPTGRAARRLSESSGYPTATVHKLLEYTFDGNRYFFGRNEDNPLEADAIIIDEASMLDISLTNSLLKAIAVGARVVFVGDIDQLPSVGPGTVLRDIIRSGRMPVVRLQNIFRQAALSPIVVNAHRINRGQFPECVPGSDFTFTETAEEEKAADLIVDNYQHFVRQEGWDSVQVLSPMHRNICGVMNLNKLLQANINPQAPWKNQLNTVAAILRVGDKVMQVRNNYEKDVFNGDIGRIERIENGNVLVVFPFRLSGEAVEYAQGELDELQLAYAMSVHKSQGSEYNTVIMPLVAGHYIMLQRNLFYTAVTRAKKRVLLVGSRAAVNTALANDDTTRRYSLLAERMQEERF